MFDVKTIRDRANAAHADSLIMPYLQIMLIEACDEIEALQKSYNILQARVHECERALVDALND